MLEFAAIAVTIVSVSYFYVVVDLSAPAAAGVILFSIVKIHQYAERNSRKGIGIFGPTPHPSGTVRVVQSRNDDEDAIKELESHFGLNNVIEVDQLIQDSNILSDVLIESRYLFVFSDLEAWTTFYGDTDAFIEDFELVGETQRSVGVEDEQTEWRLLMARLASICLDHYASAFISRETE